MPVFTHQSWCKRRVHQDPARRLSDTYNLHKIAADSLGIDNIGKWFAVALSDGRGDNELYDNKRDCVRHQKHNENQYVFIKIGPASMSPCEAEVMLATHRRLYSRGMRMADPDHRSGGMDLIKRTMVEDQRAVMRGIARNLIMPWEAN